MTNQQDHCEKISSRIRGFYRMDVKNRLQHLVKMGVLSDQDAQSLHDANSLPLDRASDFIENCIGLFPLPLGIATNFVIDGEDILIPMAVEETSVVAAASNGARMVRGMGGFTTQPVDTISTCQVLFEHLSDEDVQTVFKKVKPQIEIWAQEKLPRLIERGGGVRGVELRSLHKKNWYVIHIHVDTQEAMGANMVNTVAEDVGARLPSVWPGCNVLTKILTNLSILRVARATCLVNCAELDRAPLSGFEVAQRICNVWEFASIDPFRATTHNKGVMNGIDPVVIATGNDWRAIEAACHAYTSLSGQYTSMTSWKINADGHLQGDIALPIAVGAVGGVTRLHPAAVACLKIMGSPSSARLSQILACVGLAQNLSAIRALACEGIQEGHMRLHEKNLTLLKQGQ